LKIYLTLTGVFLSFTLLAYSGLFPVPPVERIGCTELNGDGCVCHSLYEDSLVQVWVEGPETLAVGQTALYKMFLAGGPAEAGGYNVAGRFGTMSLVDTISKWDYRSPNELTQAFPLVFSTPLDTIFWPFEYTASDSSSVDTIYSCGLSIVYDSIPDFRDVWGFGPKFPLTIVDAVPVELTSFSGEIKNSSAFLFWRTASELNNKGFEIYGTTSEFKEYRFVDNNILTGKNYYRLKQIDFDGRFKYSDVVEINFSNNFSFVLNQNYPNPFNPETKISWNQESESHISLKIYDVLGNEIAVLLNNKLEAGSHEINFSAKNLPSGIYLYTIESGENKLTKKMLLLK
jgi:hypothetical protein